MPIKFFPADVLGDQPANVGDYFMAMFMGTRSQFVVTEWYGSFFFAEFVS